MKILRSNFFKYAIIGGFATLIDASLLFILTDLLGVFYIVSNVMGFIAGLIFNYQMSIRYVFKISKYDPRTEFLLYTAIGIFGLFLNTGLLWFLTDGIGIYYMLSKMMATGLVFISNYLLRKYLLFKEAHE